MNILKLFGDTNVSISDTLFNNKNVKYVSIFHNTCDCISKRPETTGSITFIKGELFSGKLGDSLEGFSPAVIKVIKNHDVVTGLDKLNTGMGADIAGASGN